MDSRQPDRPSWCERFTLAAGTLLVPLALGVIAGWLLHERLLVQVLPGAVPMQFNTALLIAILGLALVALAGRQYRWVWRIALLVLLVAAATFAQDLLGIELGIDNLLFRDWSGTGPGSPGRMATNTAACFLLAGACLVSQSFPRRWRQQPLAECLASSVLLGIAVVSASGYASGLAAAYGWAGQAGMAVHSAIAFVLVAAALSWAALSHERQWAETTPWWLPLPVSLAMLTMSIVNLQALCLDQEVRMDRETAVRAVGLAERIESRLLEQARELERMARRWSMAGQPQRQHWQAEAALLLEHFPDVEAVAWIDPTETVRWAAPMPGNEALLHSKMSREPNRHNAFCRARDEQRATVTSIVDLMQGGKGLIVVSPIYCQGQFEGCFAAAFRVDVIAWELSLDDQEAGYEVSLFQGPREVYGRSPALQGGNRRLAEANIAYGDSALRVGVCPSVQTIAEQGQALRGVSIVTGILRVIAATLFAFFAQRAFEHSRTAKRAAERARESEWRFRAIFDQTFQFIGLLTTDGTLVEANRTALQFAGIPEADVIGKPFWQTPWWRHSFDLQQQLRAAIARAAKGECIRFEASHVNADGETRFVDFSLKPVYDDVGHIHMLVPEGRDITDRKRAEDELTRAARLDKLTGLPSRGLLLDRLRETIARARESENYRYALMFLDFDRFKLINDSLGHDAGDDLLRQIAARLRGNIRSIHSVSRSEIGNTAARLGGDEFVVLLDEVELHSDVLVTAKRLLSAFAQPYRLATQDVYSTASIGIVNGGPEYEQAEDVLRDADTAMYEAKRAGKARYVVFDTSMRERLQRRVRLESDLRKAIENGELSLACQPIVSLSTGEILSVEMLLRWMHPTEGLIEPGEFVPIAEESDLMYGLSEWVLVTGCQHMAAWIQTLGSAAPATVSVNLSRRQFAMPGLFSFIEQVLRQTGLDPQRLQLEIAEDVFVVDERTAIDTMRALRGLGVHLAIDDFGAGTSTFASIHRFPVDMFKVDRSLLAGIEESPDTAALIHALAVLLKNLSICLVAEGVETADQALTLQELGCHHAQGDFFAAPMAASEFEDFISRSISIDHSESGAMAFEARWADRLSL